MSNQRCFPQFTLLLTTLVYTASIVMAIQGNRCHLLLQLLQLSSDVKHLIISWTVKTETQRQKRIKLKKESYSERKMSWTIYKINPLEIYTEVEKFLFLPEELALHIHKILIFMIKYMLNQILMVLLKTKIVTENAKVLHDPRWPQSASIRLSPPIIQRQKRYKS